MSKQVEFRLAEPKESQKVLDLLANLEKQTKTFFVDSNIKEISPATEAKQIDLMNHSKEKLMAVAAIGEDLIGIITIWEKQDHQGEVGIAVLKQYQRITIGSNLLQLAIDWGVNYSNLDSLYLEVYTNNLPAVHLYKQNRFEIIDKKNSPHGLIYEMLLPLDSSK